ncbi:hypothetical protein [Dactylosporangium cerinum]
MFLRELPAGDAKDLYVVWGGHGYLDTGGRRRLYLADAIESDAVDFDLDSLLVTYRSDLVAALRRQLWLIDVCQLHDDDDGRPRVRGHETFPAGEPVAGLTQQVLFAAGHGQGAADLRVQQTGLFSREVLRLLHRDGGAALLADPPALFEALRERFTTRRGPGWPGRRRPTCGIATSSATKVCCCTARPGSPPPSCRSCGCRRRRSCRSSRRCSGSPSSANPRPVRTSL